MRGMRDSLSKLGIELYKDGESITGEQAKAELHRRGMTLEQEARQSR
jgi:hypothetical protein